MHTISTVREKCAYIYLEQQNFYYFYSLRKFFFQIKINIFGSNVYFFTLKTHFLKVKILFFDLNMIVLIVNTFSLRL